MAVLKPRSRILSIRLSEEEFLTLSRLRSVFGARSLSDLARDCMRRSLNGVGHDEVLDSRMNELRACLKKMDSKIDRIASAVTPGQKSDL
jgi:hypothetical protein